MNVAVTAVGGGVGQSIIKALQHTEYSTIGINSEVLGAGLYATRKSYIGPYANDPKYVDMMIKICRKEKCAAIFPGLDIELSPLSNNIKRFKNNDILPVVSDPTVIAICADKLKTCEFLQSNNFPSPRTFRLRDYSFELNFPITLKPQKGGHGSIGVLEAHDRSEFDRYMANVDVNNYIVQEHIEGDEYTCGTVTLEKRCVGTILMKRELRAGDTYKAFVVKDEKLSNFVRAIINALQPFGACNVQLRLRDNVPYIFEINARCSGTTASRALAGFNEPKIICDYVSKGITNPRFEIKEITILRYWKELAVSYGKIERMKSEGFIQNENIEL
jgi:carbamoyl-phosphate synthase large subunit